MGIAEDLLKNPPPVPKGVWTSNVPYSAIQIPYIPYVFAQVVYASRGEVGYEWEVVEEKDGFLLHLKIEPLDRENCESLYDVEEIWLKLRCA